MESSKSEIRSSIVKWVSYGFGNVFYQFLLFGNGYLRVLYEYELSLNPFFTDLAFFITALLGALISPLIGYLSDRKFRFTKKRGRRFPWIIIGGVSWIISYIFLYIPALFDFSGEDFLNFGWLMVFSILFTISGVIFYINYKAVYPDNFRQQKERRYVSTTSILVGFVLAYLSLIPPIFIQFEVPSSYFFHAIIIAPIGLILLLTSFKGVKIEEVYLDRFLRNYEKQEKEPFIVSVKQQIFRKNIVIYFIAVFLYQSASQVNLYLVFTIRFILGEETTTVVLMFLVNLIATLVSVPIWVYIGNKLNDNKKTIVYGAIILCITTIFMLFLPFSIALVILIALFGFGSGCFSVLLNPLLGDVIDDNIVATNQRYEGLVYGMLAFVIYFSSAIEFLFTSLIQILTGITLPIINSQGLTPIELFMLWIQLALFPVILMIVVFLLFWRFYDLTHEKVLENKEKLRELEL